MALFHPGECLAMKNNSLAKYFVLALYLNIVYLIKTKALTYTLYKEHCELYTEIHSSIAVNSCQLSNLPEKTSFYYQMSL